MAENNIHRIFLFQINRPSFTLPDGQRIDILTTEINRVLALISDKINSLEKRISALEEKKG